MPVCRLAQHHLGEDLSLPGPVRVLHGDSQPPERLPGHQGRLPLLRARAAGDQGQCGAQWAASPHLGGLSQVEEWHTLASIQCTTAAGNVTWSSPAPTLCLCPPPTVWAAAPPPSTTSPPSTSPCSTSSGQGQAGTTLDLLIYLLYSFNYCKYLIIIQLIPPPPGINSVGY